MRNRVKCLQVSCEAEESLLVEYRDKLPEVTRTIIENCHQLEHNRHVDYEPLPSKEAAVDIIEQYMQIVFPGYFSPEKLDPVNLDYHLGQGVTRLFRLLATEIANSIRHDCRRYDLTCQDCVRQGYALALKTLETIPALRNTLTTDVQAAYDGDPAAHSHDEIIFSYPGLLAMAIYRLAHVLYELRVPLLPRIMTEYAHGQTGIDIHPGARIGERFCIDHGTGVVIGETATIGRDVRLYQGVTLGALSLPPGAGETMKGQKRHPDIEDGVIIYAGATILGGKTRIGARSVIGGNVWLTESVPPDTRVMIEKPQLVFRNAQNPLSKGT